MTSRTERMAMFRRRKKATGFRESTIWLSPEDDEIINRLIERNGLKTQAEVIRYALREISSQDNQMQP